MSNSILTNGGASFISSQMDKSRAEQVRAQTQLASGLKNPDPANNPSGTAISLKLGSDVIIARTIQDMAVQGGSMVSLAVSVLNNTAAVLNRLKELATLSTSTTINDTDRDNLQAEFAQLVSQVNSNAQTKFAGTILFDGNFSGAIQLGLDATDTVAVAFTDFQSANFGGATDLTALDISTSTGAATAVIALDSALTALLSELASVSAIKSRLEVANQNMGTIVQNYELAQSTYRDVNVTEALANAQRAQALVEAGSSALQQNVNMFTSLSRMIQGGLR
jgi:flagellin